MGYPEQIQRQVDAANAVIKQYEEQSAEEVKPQPAESSTVPDSQPADSKPDTESEKPAPKAEVPPSEDENSYTFKQRWLSLQGQFNSLNQRVQFAEERNAQLENLLTSMQQAEAQKPAEAKPSLVTDADREAFGEDMIDVVRRAAREEVAAKDKEIAELRGYLRQLQQVVPAVQQVQQVQRQTAQEKFFSDLAKDVPDWKAINSNPDFVNWLFEVDPFTKITRQTYLTDAQRSGDLERVVSIFNAWKSISGVADTQQQTKRNTVQNELEMQVAPGREATSTPAPQGGSGKIWTRAEIAKFYDDARRGKFKGREADRAALERDIFVAQKEGRIQG